MSEERKARDKRAARQAGVTPYALRSCPLLASTRSRAVQRRQGRPERNVAEDGAQCVAQGCQQRRFSRARARRGPAVAPPQLEQQVAVLEPHLQMWHLASLLARRWAVVDVEM